MRAVFLAFRRYIEGILDDYMLIACSIAPIIMVVAFHFAIPALEQYLCDAFSTKAILSPYYLIFDLLIAVMTPVMFSFSGVMATLEEIDNGTAYYLMVTPIGKSGYIASRIGLPALIAVPYSIILMAVLGLSGMSLLMNIAISFLCAVTGIIVSIFVIAFANNKVEGMALIKMSGIIVLGIPAVFFLPTPILYICGILPSYWYTIMAKSQNYLYALPAVTISVIWLFLIYRKFSRKLLG